MILQSNLSHFQTLPRLVIDNIFQRYCTVSSNVYDIYNIETPIRVLLKLLPLLGCCRSWRFVALEALLGNHGVRIDKNMAIQEFTNCPKDLEPPVKSSAPWVRNVGIDLTFPIISVPAGEQLVSLVFSNAHTVCVRICCNESGQPDPNILELPANIDKCAQLLRQMLPNVCNVELSNVSMPNEWEREPFTLLLHHLVKMATGKLDAPTFDNWEMLDPAIEWPSDANQITTLRMGHLMDTNAFGVIRRCSERLRVLHLVLRNPQQDYSPLLREGDNYMVYPNVEHLQIEYASLNSWPIGSPTFPGAVPFPNLKHLECGLGGYPFNDDVLFRGNQSTLQSLVIDLHPDFIKLLADHCVFASSSHPHLRSLEVRTTSVDNEIESLASFQRKTIQNIMRHVLKFQWKGHESWWLSMEHLGAYSLQLQSLQKVHIQDVVLGPIDTMDFILSIPQLRVLECRFEALRKPSKSTTYAQYLQYLKNEYCPLNQNLQMLQITEWHYEKISLGEVRAIAAMVIICPSIRLVRIKHVSPREKISHLVNKVLGQKGFKDYEQMIRSVLFFLDA